MFSDSEGRRMERWDGDWEMGQDGGGGTGNGQMGVGWCSVKAKMYDLH